MIEKRKLLECIGEELENSSSYTDDEIYEMLFYPIHRSKQTIDGLRLRRLGLLVFQKIEKPYVYDGKLKLTSKAVIRLSTIKTPWFFDSGNLILFDKILYAKLKLLDDFDRFIKIL